ncbi:hypothetical protein Q8F55_005499 [Vanrija albida]|uniref:Uncharacterized protein n=1 Tax=Vanrija albida TaxID=181172 RepID=A0ABR3Q1T7_9TREE
MVLPIHNSLAEYVDFHQFKALVAAYNDNGGLVPPVSRWAASEVVELARLIGASHQSTSEQRYEVELLKFRVLQAQPAPDSALVPSPAPSSPDPAAPGATPVPARSAVLTPADSFESFSSSPSSELALITTAQLKASNAELASVKSEIETVRRQLQARNAMLWHTPGYAWLPVASLQGAIPSNLPPITSLAAFNALDRPSLVAWAKYYAGAAHARLIDAAAASTDRDGFLRRLVGMGVGVGDPAADAA